MARKVVLRQIGFVNGCFDVMHYGHLKLLEYAKSECDFLVVAIDSDCRVRRSKGQDRPINNQEVRKYFLKSLVFVDKVEIFEDDSELDNLVQKYHPDLMVVGSDYEDKEVIGSRHAKEVRFFERIDGYSTTAILQYTFNR